jgi:hypothetical protein
VPYGIDMFDPIIKQLELQTLGKDKNNFKISEQEFQEFRKSFLFDQIKGNKLGVCFCEKYKLTNYVLTILSDESAIVHIKTFYVK